MGAGTDIRRRDHMPKIAIVTDTGADLTPAQQAQYGITVVPLVLRFGTETYFDNQVALDEFWAKARHGPPFPATSQPPTGLYEEAFRSLIAKGSQVLCLCITSKHSGTVNSAYAAAQSFPGQVTVFDTLSLTLAQAYQAITASQMAAQGHGLDEILARLEGIRARTHFGIALDTIEYLRRGGRADQVMPVLERVCRVLNIKPLLGVVDGQLKLLSAARSREKSWQHIIHELSKHVPAEAVFVAHTRLTAEAPGFARTLAEQLHFPLEQIPIAETGAILSSHAGPGVMAAAVVQRSN
jgi:DegV family protein with EDD domain